MRRMRKQVNWTRSQSSSGDPIAPLSGNFMNQMLSISSLKWIWWNIKTTDMAKGWKPGLLLCHQPACSSRAQSKQNENPHTQTKQMQISASGKRQIRYIVSGLVSRNITEMISPQADLGKGIYVSQEGVTDTNPVSFSNSPELFLKSKFFKA